MRMLTTPATASEPQAAEAPPVTTSIRSTRLEGIVLMSTPPCTLEDTTRCPSNSTRLRLKPRLRSETRFRPATPAVTRLWFWLLFGEADAPNEGRSRIRSATSMRASRAIASPPITVTGVGAS